MGSKSKNLTSAGISKEIEKIAASEDVTYLDAICHYCELHGLDEEELAASLHSTLIEKLENEAIKLNLVKGDSHAKLPF